MLFDLRGRGRRRAVQAIYLALALLMGGGLVLFGIGSSSSGGGLLDAFTGNGSGGNGSGAIAKQVQQTETATRQHPQDARAWSQLALRRFQLASLSKGYDQTTGAFTGEAQGRLGAAVQAWQRHVQLAGDKADPAVAAQMTNAYQALGKPAEAARAWNVVVAARSKPGYGDFARLAELQYLASNSRQGDLAASAAVRVAPKAQRAQLKQALDGLKAQALSGRLGGTRAGAPAGPGAPPGGGGTSAPVTPGSP